jgi:hypothetical protein
MLSSGFDRLVRQPLGGRQYLAGHDEAADAKADHVGEGHGAARVEPALGRIGQ